MKKVLLMAVMTVMSSAAFAERSTGTVEALYIHDHFSQVIIKGETAQKIYERLQTPENQDVNGAGENIGSLSKISADGRMWCRKIPQGASYCIPSAQGTFQCEVTFDSTSGSVNQPWSN